MARPLSEEKREALLTAAANLVSTLGTGASTAKIARLAGVSEGTLFTYFQNKDELLNELFVQIELDLANSILAPISSDLSAKDKLWLIWCRLIDWGLKNPVWRKTIRQLKVSDRVTEASRQRCAHMFHEARSIVEDCLVGRFEPNTVGFYIDTALFGLANIVIDTIASNPQDHDIVSEAGFMMYWKGTE